MTTSKEDYLQGLHFILIMCSCFRYNYDKKLSELSAADDDHPLKAGNMSFANLSLSAEQSSPAQALPDELNSVAVDWKPMRNVTTCSCSTPFDQFSKKVGAG